MDTVFSIGSASISLAGDSSSYTITLPGIAPLTCRIAVEEGGSVFVADKIAAVESAEGLVLKATAKAAEVAVYFKPGAGEASIDITAEASLKELRRKIRVFPLYGATAENAVHLLSHGRTMGGCKTCKLPAAILETEPGEEPSSKFSSFFQTVISFKEIKLHITQPLRQNYITNVTGEIDGSSITGLSIGTCLENAGPCVYRTPCSTLAAVTDGFKAMCDWGDSQKAGPLPSEPQPFGWNSWDYYRWTITEDEVMKNAEFIASDPVLSKHIKRIIVDDGWQYCYGEWEANSLFKSGMDTLARNLRKMGFVPGLWICPGIAEPHSRIAQWDTDWLAMSEGGDPCLSFDCMRRKGFIIDPTVPAVKKWLFDLFTKYADMGYGYFKTDFLIPVCDAPRYHADVPRGQIIRELMTPITDAIRGKAELLGCGYDYNGGCDLVKMVRAGGDIHATWSSVRNNAVSVAARFWASNRVWVTDPDFCVCRGPETSADPDLGRLRCLYVFVEPGKTSRELVPGLPCSFGFDNILAHEAECLLSLAIMNGGAMNLSDKLYVLNDRGLDLLRRTVSATRGSAPQPVDLFETDLASKWIQKTPGGYRVLLINWDDEEKEMAFDLSKFGINVSGARDFWKDTSIKVSSNTIKASIRAHGCMLAEIEH